MAEYNTLARWVVEKGMKNIDPSMLSAEMKKDVFTEAGLMLFRANRVVEAIIALQHADNNAKLLEMGDEYFRQAQFELAALVYIPTGDKDRLDKAASICAREGRYAMAYHAFKAAGNEQMASFLQENFEIEA